MGSGSVASRSDAEWLLSGGWDGGLPARGSVSRRSRRQGLAREDPRSRAPAEDLRRPGRLRCGVRRGGRRQSACVTRNAAMTSTRKSTMGRPRRLSDADVARILDWHEARRAWWAAGASLKSRRALAAELGVSPSTISHVIACQGCYKQPSPECRDQGQARRRRVLQTLQGRRRR